MNRIGTGVLLVLGVAVLVGCGGGETGSGDGGSGAGSTEQAATPEGGTRVEVSGTPHDALDPQAWGVTCIEPTGSIRSFSMIGHTEEDDTQLHISLTENDVVGSISGVGAGDDLFFADDAVVVQDGDVYTLDATLQEHPGPPTGTAKIHAVLDCDESVFG